MATANSKNVAADTEVEIADQTSIPEQKSAKHREAVVHEITDVEKPSIKDKARSAFKNHKTKIIAGASSVAFIVVGVVVARKRAENGQATDETAEV